MGLNTENDMNAHYENMKSTWLKTLNSTCVYTCFSVWVLEFVEVENKLYFFNSLSHEVCVIKAVIFSRWLFYLNIFFIYISLPVTK